MVVPDEASLAAGLAILPRESLLVYDNNPARPRVEVEEWTVLSW